MRSASALQPSAGAWRSAVSSPVGPPWPAIAASASTTAPRSGSVPPIMTHQAERNSRVAAGSAELPAGTRAHESEARPPSVPAVTAAPSAAIAASAASSAPSSPNGTGRPSRSSPPVRQRTADGLPVGARAEAVARELGGHLGVLGREPRAADLDLDVRARERPRPGAPARAIPGLEHEHRAARLGEIARRAQPGEARADDDRVVRLAHAGSGATSSQAVAPHVIASHTQSAPRSRAVEVALARAA